MNESNELKTKAFRRGFFAGGAAFLSLAIAGRRLEILLRSKKFEKKLKMRKRPWEHENVFE